MLEYHRQPPSTTLKGCNPYNHNGLIRIVLDCVVWNQTADEFEIRWFRENLAGAVEDLGHGDPDRVSRYHHTNFISSTSYLTSVSFNTLPENSAVFHTIQTNAAVHVITTANINCADLSVNQHVRFLVYTMAMSMHTHCLSKNTGAILHVG